MPEWRVSRFSSVPSTNDLALEWLQSGRAVSGDVIVAEEQTAGRGRRGRDWHSPRGALLMTAILPFYPERGGWASLAAGLAVARAARDFGAPAAVKWPNDVILNNRKLGGILAEAALPGLVAVGIGLNVSNALPDESVVRAARLADFIPGLTIEQALTGVLDRLGWAWELLTAADLSPLREAWRGLDGTSGRRLRWSEEGVTGTAEGVDPAGALVIRADDGRLITAHVGEVGFL